MCGIFGTLSLAPMDPSVLHRAGEIQRHRGPDASGVERLTVGRLQVGLAHQRLAILDLSDAGRQPMRSPSGRSLIVYNGEVYNYLELRKELEGRGVDFVTGTDTEVIAAACEEYGVAGALARMNGMWAFLWIDLVGHRIVLARDRFGVKPLYLYKRAGLIAFASEIKTLVRTLDLKCAVNVRAVAAFLQLQQLDTNEETFFEGIVKLRAGHYEELDADSAELRPRLVRYWSLDREATAVHGGSSGGIDGTEEEAIETTQSLLCDATRLRLRSDVPLGLLLSGGLDSSAIAAFAVDQLKSGGDLTFISAVSDDPRSDESPFIRTVGSYLRRPVREVRLEMPTREILPLIDKVTEQCDEPIGSFACVAQNLLMRCARELGVTVLLSGQGADEVFCGYRKYAAFQVQALLRAGRWLTAARLIAGFVREGTVLKQFSLADARRYLPQALTPRLPSVAGPALADARLLGPPLGNRPDPRDRQRADVESLSVPALTHWEDRNSMAWSCEVRNPFLDYRLVKFGINLPMCLKIHRGWTKYVLRRAIEARLPASIVWRRDKRGFSTPEARILRHELRARVDEIVASDSEMVRRGLVRADEARSCFTQFLEARSALTQRVASREIFQLLSLELWLRAYRDNLSG